MAPAGTAPGQPVAGAAFPPVVLDPYAKTVDLNQALTPEQLEAYKHHRLTAFPSWAFVVLSIVTLGIFGAIYHLLKHGRLPVIKHNDPSAGKAIGFLFIPFFNLYWVFVVWPRLADRINFQYRLRGQPPPISRGLVITTAVLLVTGSFILVTYPFGAITAMISGVQIQSAANRLVKEGGVQPAAISTQASAAAPAGWYPDPTGQAAQRYWSGTAWTDQVS
jgi:uncharacterized protein DUF2510